jgi:hypothetical protein
MASNCMTFIPNFMKIGELIKKLGHTCVCMHTHTQYGALIGLHIFLKKIIIKAKTEFRFHNIILFLLIVQCM